VKAPQRTSSRLPAALKLAACDLNARIADLPWCTAVGIVRTAEAKPAIYVYARSVKLARAAVPTPYLGYPVVFRRAAFVVAT
jgi:hypothetical protein